MAKKKKRNKVISKKQMKSMFKEIQEKTGYHEDYIYLFAEHLMDDLKDQGEMMEVKELGRREYRKMKMGKKLTELANLIDEL